MKITDIQSRREHCKLTRPYTIAFRSADSVDIIIVEIQTDDGGTGLGAASPEPFVTGETKEACINALAPSSLQWLAGRDVRTLPALCRTLREKMPGCPAAQAALDMALHDLFARHLGLPLADVLGRAHKKMATSITIGIKPVKETVEEAGEYIERGFRALKIKCGHNAEEDIERLAAVRKQFGGRVAIRVDPNQGYSIEDILTFTEKTAALQIEFIEQPAKREQNGAIRSLKPGIRKRIAADESLLTEKDALTLAAPPEACGIFNIKLMKCGGIAAAQGIARIAEAAHIDLMWGCMDESRISIAAALHAALASPATRYLDLDGHLDLERDVATGGFNLCDGMLETTGLPGLGVETI